MGWGLALKLNRLMVEPSKNKSEIPTMYFWTHLLYREILLDICSGIYFVLFLVALPYRGLV
jgi:hypothetical protein